MKNLFDGNYKRYFSYKLFYGFILLITIIILINVEIEIFYVFPIAGFLWMIFIYSYNWHNYKGEGHLKEFYKLGLASFIINAGLGFAFIADKYIVNHYMEIDIANAYTFAWGLTSPMLYLGNMIEHSIYTAGNKNKRKTIINSVILLSIAIALYIVGIITIVLFFPYILPVSIDIEKLKNILFVFLAIYSFYTLIQYPLNGVLFKFIDNNAQYKIAKLYPIIFILFLVTLYLLFINVSGSYFLLIAICASYLSILLGIKTYTVKKSIV